MNVEQNSFSGDVLNVSSVVGIKEIIGNKVKPSIIYAIMLILICMIAIGNTGFRLQHSTSTTK